MNRESRGIRVHRSEPWDQQLKRKTVVDENGCWVWQNRLRPNGYGTWYLPGIREHYAHRLVYLLMAGPIPEGLEIDHLCRNRACVNPDHLEPVTKLTNVQRGIGAEVARARHQARTHCSKGHPYSEENTRLQDGVRVCRRCKTEWARAKRWNQKEMAAHD